MNDWESQWTANKSKPVHSQALVRFGADTPVIHTNATPVVVKHGGGLSNGLMLLLGGFAIGTLWGEPIINRLIGVKSSHESK